MKTKLSLFSLIFSYFLIGIVSAQDMAFRVLATKGINSVNTHNLNIGSDITSGQIIKIGTESYLGLAHKSGKVLELKEAGMYKVSDLETRLNSNTSEITSKYINFIISELTKKQDANEMANRYKHMYKTGVICRFPSPITVTLANKEEILGDKVAINWFVNEHILPKGTSLDEATVYQVIIMGFSGDVIYQTETQANILLIDLKKEDFADNKFFTYKIRVKGHEKITTEEHAFIKMKDKKAKKFFNDYSELAQSNTALGKIIQAKYLEEQGLLPEAMAAYYEALRLEVGVEAYQILYDEFMDRAGFSKDAYLGKNKR